MNPPEGIVGPVVLLRQASRPSGWCVLAAVCGELDRVIGRDTARLERLNAGGGPDGPASEAKLLTKRDYQLPLDGHPLVPVVVQFRVTPPLEALVIQKVLPVFETDCTA